MKIVAANHADSLRRPGEADSAESALLASVREELHNLFGEADDAVPLTLAALAQRLDRDRSAQGPCAA